MIDNLRRTLAAPACMLALTIGWTLPFEPALVWTAFVLATLVLPSLIPVIAAIPGRRPGVTIARHLRALGGDLKLAATLSALNVAFLADQAWSMGDAIARTLWRLFVVTDTCSNGRPRRRLRRRSASIFGGSRSEWRERSHLQRRRCSLRSCSDMGLADRDAVRGAVADISGGRALRQPVARAERMATISEAQSQALRQIARQTWRFSRHRRSGR